MSSLSEIEKGYEMVELVGVIKCMLLCRISNTSTERWQIESLNSLNKLIFVTY